MAALNYILVAGGKTRLNSQTRQFVDLLKQVQNLGLDLAQALTKANADGAAQLLADLGLDTSDNAAAVYTLITAASTELSGAAALNNVISRLG